MNKHIGLAACIAGLIFIGYGAYLTASYKKQHTLTKADTTYFSWDSLKVLPPNASSGLSIISMTGVGGSIGIDWNSFPNDTTIRYIKDGTITLVRITKHKIRSR